MREKFTRDAFVFLLSCSFCVPAAFGQTKKKTSSKPAAKDTIIINKLQVKSEPPKQLSLLTKKADTVIIIDRKTGKPVSTKTAAAIPVRKADTIIYVDNGIRRGAKNIDSVIVLKNGKQKKDLLKNQPLKDAPKPTVVNASEVCNCISLSIKAPDTLSKDTYINYSFMLKNNCKDIVYICSSAFGFAVFNKNGTPAKVLRKMAFSKQYRYPDYVPLSPKEEYLFEYGDDAFYQYDLRQGHEYKFTFLYMSSDKKLKSAPKKTYLCNEYRDKLISIR